jgi:[lysine-biosynthesis-protein LysW]--L-2-aminoadipate ligase
LRVGRGPRRSRSLSRLHVGVLYSRVRVEEKWIFAAMDRLGLHYDRLDDRGIFFDLQRPEPWMHYDVVLERSLSYTSGLYALRMLNGWGIPTVNTASVAEVCGDKLATSAALARAGVPQPRATLAFSMSRPWRRWKAWATPSCSNRLSDHWVSS